MHSVKARAKTCCSQSACCREGTAGPCSRVSHPCSRAPVPALALLACWGKARRHPQTEAEAAEHC